MLHFLSACLVDWWLWTMMGSSISPLVCYLKSDRYGKYSKQVCQRCLSHAGRWWTPLWWVPVERIRIWYVIIRGGGTAVSSSCLCLLAIWHRCILSTYCSCHNTLNFHIYKAIGAGWATLGRTLCIITTNSQIFSISQWWRLKDA